VLDSSCKRFLHFILISAYYSLHFASQIVLAAKHLHEKDERSNDIRLAGLLQKRIWIGKDF